MKSELNDIDMVVNIQTLGRESNSLIMSIGATLFDRHDRDGKGIDWQPNSERDFYSPVSFIDSQTIMMSTQPTTMAFWRARPIWPKMSGEATKSNIKVKEALTAFKEFMSVHRPARVWANSPTFHIAGLQSAMARVGLKWAEAAEDYQRERDYRTLMDMAFPDPAERPQRPGDRDWMAEQADANGRSYYDPKLLKYFHALWDAKLLANQVVKAHALLNVPFAKNAVRDHAPGLPPFIGEVAAKRMRQVA